MSFRVTYLHHSSLTYSHTPPACCVIAMLPSRPYNDQGYNTSYEHTSSDSQTQSLAPVSSVVSITKLNLSRLTLPSEYLRSSHISDYVRPTTQLSRYSNWRHHIAKHVTVDRPDREALFFTNNNPSCFAFFKLQTSAKH